jgi:hypothetical protein
MMMKQVADVCAFCGRYSRYVDSELKVVMCAECLGSYRRYKIEHGLDTTPDAAAKYTNRIRILPGGNVGIGG